VEAAELYAEGQISHDELNKRSCEAPDEDDPYYARDDVASACFNAARWEERSGGYVDADTTAHFALEVIKAKQMDKVHEATLFQCNAFRDIVGNPFRQVPIDPKVITRAGSDLAQAVYDERTLPSGLLDPERLRVLGDALEDAGYMNADVLNHLREPNVHVRGCWVLDELLRKT
jgi:hypothetical protein